MRLSKWQLLAALMLRVRNWGDALPHADRHEYDLQFRNGLRLLAPRTGAFWYVLKEVFLLDGYRYAFSRLERLRGGAVVIDLGANIGCFTLAAVKRNAGICVVAYEPGPLHAEWFRRNLVANPILASRIEVRQRAVTLEGGTARWMCCEENPAGSTVINNGTTGVEIGCDAFANVSREFGRKAEFWKIDIEGSEIPIVLDSEDCFWKDVAAVSMEIHESDRAGEAEILKKMAGRGYRAQRESIDAWLFTR